jgi:cytochrome c
MRPVRPAAAALLLVLAAGTGGTAMAQDAAAGEQVFRRNCSACHTVVAGSNRQGPSLFGIVDRPSGAVPGFHYSTANQNAHLTWNSDTLNRYLTNPRAVVPGTTMTFVGLRSEDDRRNLIAFLATRH